jgi:hypothetical protein
LSRAAPAVENREHPVTESAGSAVADGVRLNAVLKDLFNELMAAMKPKLQVVWACLRKRVMIGCRVQKGR